MSYKCQGPIPFTIIINKYNNIIFCIDLPIEFAEETENIAGPSNAVPMHNPMFEDVLDDHVDDSSEETDTQCSKKKKRNNKKKNRPDSDMGWKKN